MVRQIKWCLQNLIIGGISSYSTVILLVAYMNYYDLKGNHNLSPSRLLMGFLDFYGNFFNASTWGVNIYNEGY